MSKKKKESSVADEAVEDVVEVDSAISTDESEIIEEEPTVIDPVEALEKELQETKVN